MVSPGDRWWVRAALVLGSLALLVGVPEAILRLVDPPLGGYRAILFGGDPASSDLFVRDPELAWRLRPGAAVTFRGSRVGVSRDGFRGRPLPAGRATVLCLGDSTTFGWEVADEEAFPALLQGLLGAGEGAPTVINAGVPGYSSAQLLLAARRLIPRWRPRLVVVCVGNNDAWPSRLPDAEALRRSPPRRLLEGIVARSRLLTWIQDLALRGRPETPASLGGPGTVPRVSEAEYARNLREVVRLARSHGAEVVLMTPTVNVFRYPVRAPEAVGENPRHERAGRLLALEAQGGSAEALAESGAWLGEAPDDPIALWVGGHLRFRSGDRAAGVELLERSLERHPYPYSAPRGYRRALLAVGREEGCLVLDANGVLGASARGRPPEALYLDHCHPTAEGHRHLAEALAAALAAGIRG